MRRLSEALRRSVSLGALKLNPLRLSATLERLRISEPVGSGTFVSVERLTVAFSASSLLRRALVVREVRVTGPFLSLVREPDGTYNVSDLFRRSLASRPGHDSPGFRFSVNNIHVERGSLDFDDRPAGVRHTVRDIEIGIPFLSNIGSDVDVYMQPFFAAKVNGAPFELKGRTRPFRGSRDTTLDLTLSDVDLPYYLAYLPVKTRLRLAAGRWDARLEVTFMQPRGRPPALVISGTTALKGIDLRDGERPLLSLPRLEASLDSFDVFARKLKLRSLTAEAPEVFFRRSKGGSSPAGRSAVPPSSSKEPFPFVLQADVAGVESGKIHFEDLSSGRPFRAVLGDVRVSLRGFSTLPGATARLEVSCRSDAGETLNDDGTLAMGPLALQGRLEIRGLPLKRYASYTSSLFAADVDAGVLDLAARYRFSAGPGGETVLSELAATLRSPRVRKHGAADPFLVAPAIELGGTSVDLGRRSVVLGSLRSMGGTLAVVREADGNADLMKLAMPPPPGSPPAAPEPWTVVVRALSLEGYTLRLEDETTSRKARYALTGTQLSATNLTASRGGRGTLSLRFGLNDKGSASAEGAIGFVPIFADLKVAVKGIDLVPLEPYLLGNLNLSLARGQLDGGGTLSLGEDAGGKARVLFAGKGSLANVVTVDRETREDFVSWDSISAGPLRAGYNPVLFETDSIDVSGIACHIEIASDGSISLRRVLGTPAAAGSVGAPAAPERTAPAPTPAPTGSAGVLPIRVGSIGLKGGSIDFQDRFVKPGYSATLRDLEGRVSGLSSQEGTLARLDLKGRFGAASPFEVSGSLNPLAASARADVRMSFRDIDLVPFTPYSNRWAGYRIARGSLGMTVEYKLEDRRLNAQNRFVLDQFELGEKVDSPEATKLPVKLAISLLKDRNGVIDLDLPVSGSLDDPKFHLGRVIMKALVNLLAKAATSPFALLGKALGGGGPDLSLVTFPPGRDTLDDGAKKSLDALGRALADRPALKLQATGRVDEAADADALQHVRLERRMKAEKAADLAKEGRPPASLDGVVIGKEEWNKYLLRVYRREKFPKPRNFLGMMKDLPPSEMERLLLVHFAAGPDDLRELALARAEAVKRYLVDVGKIDGARIQLLDRPERPKEPGGKAGGSRVDFMLA